MTPKKTDAEKQQDEFDKRLDQGFKHAAQTCRDWAKYYAKMANEFEGKAVKRERQPKA
jgi:hypothetical protein